MFRPLSVANGLLRTYSGGSLRQSCVNVMCCRRFVDKARYGILLKLCKLIVVSVR